jgi:hypothetical protein
MAAGGRARYGVPVSGVAVLGRDAGTGVVSDAEPEVALGVPFDAPELEVPLLELLERRLREVAPLVDLDAFVRLPELVELTLVEPVAGSFEPAPVFPESKIRGSVLPRPLLPVP